MASWFSNYFKLHVENKAEFSRNTKDVLNASISYQCLTLTSFILFPIWGAPLQSPTGSPEAHGCSGGHSSQQWATCNKSKHQPIKKSMMMKIKKVGRLGKKIFSCKTALLKKVLHVKQHQSSALRSGCPKTGPTKALDSGQEAHQRHLGKQQKNCKWFETTRPDPIFCCIFLKIKSTFGKNKSCHETFLERKKNTTLSRNAW